MKNNNSIDVQTSTLVIGANGKTGSRVVDRLRAANLPVRAASRSSETHFDWEDVTTWSPALEGIGAIYITYHPDLALPGAAEIVGSFADLAVEHGVKRLVLISGRGEEGARRAEERIQNSGAEWTIVRCSVFNQNFSDIFAEAVQQGVLAMPGGDTPEPFLDADDIADVVFAALTEDKHVGQLYELTGPRMLTLSEIAGELSAAVGHEVRYEPLTADQYGKELMKVGMPEEHAYPVAQLIADVFDGRNANLCDGVQQALGVPPRDFSDYAKLTAASGIWKSAEVSS